MTHESFDGHTCPPDSMTEPCSRYFHGYAELTRFIIFVTELAQRFDKAAVAGTKAFPLLDFGPREEEELIELERILKEGFGAFVALALQQQLIYEMMYCRSVDNYLVYLSEMMALIFRTRPETLRSSETIRLDELLQHETMDDVISTLTDRRVDELSFRGMRDLHGHLSDKLGFTLFEEDDKLETAVRIVEIRNIIVHNRAVVSRRFLSRVPDSQAKLGERLELGREVSGAMDFLSESCSDIDGRAASKFDLPRPILREQPAT